MLLAVLIILLSPFLLPDRWTASILTSYQELTFYLQVMDVQGKPISNALVTIKGPSGEEISGSTDQNGKVRLQKSFSSRRTRYWAHCYLSGKVTVGANGYKIYQRDLGDMFEQPYDYFNCGSNVVQRITLAK